jgi:endonuclease/exonuclease/phosphatase family metal-dependent hydrolase
MASLVTDAARMRQVWQRLMRAEGRRLATTANDGTDSDRAFLLTVALVAIATALMLQATRVFVSYLVFVIDQSNREQIALAAVAVFGASGLGGLVVRLLGRRAAVLAAGTLLGLSRLGLQFLESPEPRVLLGAAVIIGWGWLIVPLLGTQRDTAAFGLILGLGLDLAVRIAFRTVDLPWMADGARHAATLMLLIAFAGVSAALWRWTPSDSRTEDHAPVIPLLAIGPGLAIYHLMTGNLGLAQVELELDLPGAGLVLAIGTLLGTALVTLAYRDPDRGRLPHLHGPLAVVVIGALALLGLWLFWRQSALTAVGLVAGVTGSVVLLAVTLLGGKPGGWRSRGGVSLWFAIGMLLEVALIFAYYTFTGELAVIVVAWGIAILAALVAGSGGAPAPAPHPRVLLAPVGVLAVALALACGWQALDWSEPEAGAPAGAELVVMDYNIQNGFSRDNIWDLEATARTIEAQNPDIVVLQEVSRGWLLAAGADEVAWLSERLKMPFAFGANSNDGLWGNAILSRLPMSELEQTQYSLSDNLDRGALQARIATEAGELWVYGTHLDNPRDAAEVRLTQTRELIAFRGDRTPALIAGDLNSDPGDEVLRMLADAGLSDPGATLLPPGATTSQDERRIDYILVTDGLTVTEMAIPDVWTSDHRPVIARVRLAP